MTICNVLRVGLTLSFSGKVTCPWTTPHFGWFQRHHWVIHWTNSYSYVLLLSGPSLCKARHRVKICFLQAEENPWTTGFLAHGSNSKLFGAFTKTKTPLLSLCSSLENVKDFILVNSIHSAPKYLYWEWEKNWSGNYRREAYGRKPPTTASPALVHPFLLTALLKGV